MVTITVPARTGGSINVDLPSRDGGGTIDINLATRGDRPTSTAYELRDLSDVSVVNTYLQDVATAGGREVLVYPHPDGAHDPDFLAGGVPIIIPENITLTACGRVKIRSDNPTRPVFHLDGDGAQLVGPFDLEATYTRVRFSWAAGEWTAWATEWNAANPGYTVQGWLAQSWQSAWNAGNSQSPFEELGALGKTNRASAVTSYDASNLLIDGLDIKGFHTGICLQGMDLTAASAADIPTLQTYGNIVRNVTLDEYDFGILAKKQRDFTIDNITTEWLGHRVNVAQPHVIYLSNESTLFEESWNVNVGTINAYTYEGGSVFKARACKNLTWKAINCYSVHSAVAIVEACTGVGGDILVTDQHETTDDAQAGLRYAVAVVNSPGWLFGGAVNIQQRAGEDTMKAWSVENSDGVRFLQGCDVACDRDTDDGYLFRVRSSDGVCSGLVKFTDAGDTNTLLFTLSDSQEEGGNASNCVLEFGEVVGTQRLVQFVGLSADNQVWVDPSRVDGWDVAQALVDNGLGGGNVLIDPRATARKIMEVSASTDLTKKASATLTIEREGPDPEDEDALPMPRLFSNNETVTFAGRTYTWKTTLTGAANEILIPNEDIVAAFPNMANVEYGYLQLGFLNAAVMGTDYKDAEDGEIYGTGTVPHADVESEWGGNQFNIRSLTGGTGSNAYTTTETSTYASWGSGTMTGGGGTDDSLVNQTIAVTTGASALTMTIPTAPAAGTFVEFVKVDSGVGSVDCGGIVTLLRKDERVTLVYEDGAWRVQSPALALKTLADQIITAEQVAACATPADVTALIQKAADAAGVAGGVVQLPPGNITMGASAPVATNEGSAVILETGSNITFRGVPGATVLRPASNKIELFAINGATDTRFEHIHFENTYGPLLNQLGGTFNEGDDPNGGVAAHGNTANCAIRQYRGENLTVLDCTFTDFTTGVDYVGNNDSEATTAGEVIIQRCTFNGCAFAFLPKQPKRIVFTDIDAYDIIDSNGYDSPRTITGITKANPGVVTTSTTHPFTDGEQVYIFGVGGMTQVNGNVYTCKSPTATTFQLYDTAETPAAVNTSGYTTYTTGGTAGEFNNAPGHAIYVSNRPGASPDIVEISGVRATGCTSSPIKVRKGGQCTISNVNLLDNGRGIEVWNVGQLTIDSANIKLEAVSGGSEGNRNALQLTDNGPTEISNVTIDIRGIDAWGVRMLPDSPVVDYANQHARLTNVTVIQDYVGTGGKAPMIASEQDDLVVEGFRHVHPGMKSGTRAPVDLRDCQRFRVSDVKHIVPDPKTITGITAANPGVITAVGHGLTTGDTVFIDGVLGMTRMNGQDGTVTVLTADTFSMGINTSAYVAYSSGGKVYPADAPRLLVVDASSNDGTFAYRTSDLAVIPTTNTFSNNGTGNRLVRSGTPFVKESPQSTLTITEHDQFVICNRAGGGATTITLPAVAYVGQTHTITDYKGDAGTNNITISPNTGFTIKDGASVVINTNYGSATLTLVFPTIWKRTA